MRSTKPKWTQEQISLVHQMYPLGALDELVIRTGRSRQAVKHKAIQLGLSGKFHWRGTALPVGTEIRRRGENSYVMVKTLDESGAIVWMRKHHLVWRENTGELPPKGTRLVFRDGDRDNCAFLNLELIPAAESARRMTQLRTYPPALQEVVRLLSELRKTLYDREKHGRSSQSARRSDDRRENITGSRSSPHACILRSCDSDGERSQDASRVCEHHQGRP